MSHQTQNNGFAAVLKTDFITDQSKRFPSQTGLCGVRLKRAVSSEPGGDDYGGGFRGDGAHGPVGH